jgi:hypothetical protein
VCRVWWCHALVCIAQRWIAPDRLKIQLAARDATGWPFNLVSAPAGLQVSLRGSVRRIAAQESRSRWGNHKARQSPAPQTFHHSGILDRAGEEVAHVPVRSRSQPRLLILVVYVPLADEDAGARGLRVWPAASIPFIEAVSDGLGASSAPREVGRRRTAWKRRRGRRRHHWWH